MAHKYFNKHKWIIFQSKNEIVGLENYNGTYIIRIKEDGYRNWKIIYVGETRNIKGRIGAHSVLNIVKKQSKSYGKLIKVEILFCPMIGMNRKRLEGYLIRKLCPMYNYIEKGIRYGRMYELNHTLKNKYAWLKFFKEYDNY